MKDCQSYQYLIYNAKGKDSLAASQESQGRIKINVHKPDQSITFNTVDKQIPVKRFLKLLCKPWGKKDTILQIF